MIINPNIVAKDPTSIHFNIDIAALPTELLGRIFELNASMDEDLARLRQQSVAFTTLLSSSLVCQLWRQIVLNAPALWGRVVNLDRLRWVYREWWDELLRRTGNATLHVKAHTIRKTDSPEFAFLKRILEDHWDRIQVLEIEVPYPIMEHLIPAFQHPTTSLVVFHGEIIAPLGLLNSNG